MEFLDRQDLMFRRDRTEFLFAMFSREISEGRSKSDVKRQILGLKDKRPYTMVPEEVEGLIERLGLGDA